MIWCFKDPTYVLMRVLLCEIHCPFICFCKPSPHISLKLENTPQVSSSTTVVDDDDDDLDHYVDAHVDGLLNEVREEDLVTEKKEEDCAVEEKQEEEQGQSHGEILRSSLKKAVWGRREKKKVQWVDLMGKELAEIREFKSSEADEIRHDGDKNCVCVIL